MQGLQSQVPGLMTSLHTTVLSRIVQYLGYLDPPTLPGMVRPSNPTPVPWLIHDPDTKESLAILTQEFRLRISRARPPDEVLEYGEAGIVLFGMISGRHGTTPAAVDALCKALSKEAIPDTFRVIIAGKEAGEKLVAELRALAATTPRLIVMGVLESFDKLAHCKYALSFDPHGFRTNASAMINVLRAGHVLFSRISGEDDAKLIKRAVDFIKLSGARGQPVSHMAARQLSRYLDSDELTVGRRLGQFFDSIAAKDVHRQISDALAEFAANMPHSRVAGHGGYRGGRLQRAAK